MTHIRTSLFRAALVAAVAASLLLSMTVVFQVQTAQAAVDTGAPGIVSVKRLAADAPAASTKKSLSNPLGTESIPELVGRIVKIITGVSGSFALLMFVYGGFLWLTSGGNADQVMKGRKVFTWAAIGLVVIFGGYALVSLVFKAIGA